MFVGSRQVESPGGRRRGGFALAMPRSIEAKPEIIPFPHWFLLARCHWFVFLGFPRDEARARRARQRPCAQSLRLSTIPRPFTLASREQATIRRLVAGAASGPLRQCPHWAGVPEG